MKKEVRIEGTAFTRRRKVVQRTETPDELAEGLRELARWSQDPWEAMRPQFEWVERALASERKGKGRGHKFRPHEDAGWYLDEMWCFIQTANFNIQNGDARWAAYAGAKFGELWSEFQFKLAREEFFLVGKKAAEDRAAGGAATRRTPDLVRVERWRHFYAETGKKTEADRLAANELGEGESTIRAARAKWEKAAVASD